MKRDIELPSLPSYEGIGDPLHFDVTGKSLQRLKVLLALVEENYTGYMISEKDNRIILFKYFSEADKKDTRICKFMTEQRFDIVAEQVYTWLNQADYGKEPDTDGSTAKGYRVKVDDIWGHVYLEKPEKGEYGNSSWSAAVAIEPYWLIYGK